jgi:hypothetical protein
VLQPAHQILAHLLDQQGMVVEESEDALQERVEVDALVLQFEIGKAELGFLNKLIDACHPGGGSGAWLGLPHVSEVLDGPP